MRNRNNHANKESEAADERWRGCNTNETMNQDQTPYRINGICSISSNYSTSTENTDVVNISHTVLFHSI